MTLQQITFTKLLYYMLKQIILLLKRKKTTNCEFINVKARWMI